jgi:hypothetical protein
MVFVVTLLIFNFATRHQITHHCPLISQKNGRGLPTGGQEAWHPSRSSGSTKIYSRKNTVKPTPVILASYYTNMPSAVRRPTHHDLRLDKCPRVAANLCLLFILSDAIPLQHLIAWLKTHQNFPVCYSCMHDLSRQVFLTNYVQYEV